MSDTTNTPHANSDDKDKTPTKDCCTIPPPDPGPST